MPKISVILPVYNTPENYLRQAINSILNQTYKDFELIIINDASTNNAEEVILSYKDTRIKYYKNRKNLKVIKTLNKGLKLAMGEYIARMDADDISFKTRFAKQVAILDNNPNIGVVASAGYLIPSKRKIQPPEDHIDLVFLMKYYANCVIHPVVMFRKSLIENFNLKYSLKYQHVEDYKLWLEMFNYTEFYTIQKPLLLHRNWTDSVSSKNAQEQYFRAKMLNYYHISKDLKIKNKNLKLAYEKFIKQSFLTKEEIFELIKMYDKLQTHINKNANHLSRYYISIDLNRQKYELEKKLKALE